jgi:hypothetical protein
MKEIGICAIVKDEPLHYLYEWFEYYRALGVEQFFIYDNDSGFPVEPAFDIKVFKVSGACQQIPSYNRCLLEHGRDLKWLAFIDADEFVLPAQQVDLSTLLKGYDKDGVAGLSINWAMYGNPDGIENQVDSVLRRFVKRVPRDWHDEYSLRMTNSHVKTFCRPFRTERTDNPHYVVAKPGNIALTTAGNVIQGAYCDPDWSVCRINHYWVRSRSDWCAKLERGKADAHDRRLDAEAEFLNKDSIVVDKTILSFLRR